MIGLVSRLAGVAILYFITGHVGMLAAVDGSVLTPVWPASGVALAVILFLGYPMAIGIAAGSFALNMTVGLSPLVSIAIGVGNNLEYVGGAYLLRRFAGFRPALDRPQDVFALMLLSATLSTTFSAFPGLTVLILGGVESWDRVGWLFLKWWQGGMTGVLLMAPLLLAWRRSPRPILSLRVAMEGSALFAMQLAVWYLIFDMPSPSGHGYYPAILAVIPFSIWGALRFGLRGITLVNLVNVGLGIWGTTHGTGPFAGESPMDSLVRWCLFANVISMTGLFLGAMADEQRRAQWALKQSHDLLEQRVRERTAELATINEGLKREVAERKRLEAELIQADEEQQRKFGMELHDGLGQHLTSIAFFGATLRQRLEAQALPEAAAAGRIVALLNQAIETVRALAHGLYPAALKSDGMATALKQLADTTCALRGVSCDFRPASLAAIDDPLIAINLYRIAQEAVNNALRHGQAAHVTIELGLADGQHRLSISDDGAGFDPGKTTCGGLHEGSSGIGLRNMYYRASLLGGSLCIDSKPHEGTTVTVRCPTRR